MFACGRCTNRERFERREYVRHDTIVDASDGPVENPEGDLLAETLGGPTYRCASCGSHDIRNR